MEFTQRLGSRQDCSVNRLIPQAGTIVSANQDNIGRWRNPSCTHKEPEMSEGIVVIGASGGIGAAL
ncbi:hypothetical protein NL539_18535, partial [Aeromonas sp. CPF2-S1]|nr:hypothetical protein [Aeromonas sp. CPF2-S1]